MTGADVVGVVGKSAFWVQSRVGLSFSPFSIWLLCRQSAVEWVGSWRFLSRSVSSGRFPSRLPVKLGFGAVGLWRRARRGERYCVVAVAMAFVSCGCSCSVSLAGRL
ncbi:unnamed protein product [Brassica oleracea]